MNTLTTVVVRPARGFRGLQLAEFWEYRELLFFLVWREVKVPYKQTVGRPEGCVPSPRGPGGGEDGPWSPGDSRRPVGLMGPICKL
jgi:hypothetical protein